MLPQNYILKRSNLPLLNPGGHKFLIFIYIPSGLKKIKMKYSKLVTFLGTWLSSR